MWKITSLRRVLPWWLFIAGILLPFLWIRWDEILSVTGMVESKFVEPNARRNVLLLVVACFLAFAMPLFAIIGGAWRWVTIPGALLLVFLMLVFPEFDVIMEEMAEEARVQSTSAFRNTSYVLWTIALFFFGMPFTVWRNLNLDKQAKAALKQAEAAHKQAEIQSKQTSALIGQASVAEQGLMNSRFYDEAGRLGDKDPYVRMAGVLALERLAIRQSDDYYVQTTDLLCYFIRSWHNKRANNVGEGTSQDDVIDSCPEDVERAMQAIGLCRLILDRDDRLDALEVSPFTLDLEGANLVGARLDDANYSRANFIRADMNDASFADSDLGGAVLTNAILERTSFLRANLAEARLTEANLMGASLGRAVLTGADLSGANLSNADLMNTVIEDASLLGATGLTQAMLRDVRPSPPPASMPPGLRWPFERAENGVWLIQEE